MMKGMTSYLDRFKAALRKKHKRPDAELCSMLKGFAAAVGELTGRRCSVVTYPDADGHVQRRVMLDGILLVKAWMHRASDNCYGMAVYPPWQGPVNSDLYTLDDIERELRELLEDIDLRRKTSRLDAILEGI